MIKKIISAAILMLFILSTIAFSLPISSSYIESGNSATVQMNSGSVFYGEVDAGQVVSWKYLKYQISGTGITAQAMVNVSDYENFASVKGSTGWFSINADGVLDIKELSSTFNLPYARYARFAIKGTGGAWQIDQSWLEISTGPDVFQPKTYSTTGTEKTTFNDGDNVVIKVNVTDPDGASDIGSVLINITDPNGVSRVINGVMSVDSSISYGKTYRYNFSTTNVNGTWSFTIVAKDSTEKTDSKAGSFVIVDTHAPTITLNSPANNDWTNNNKPTFYFTPDDYIDPVLDCSLYIDGNACGSTTADRGQQSSITSTCTLTVGAHNWYIKCTDDKGNTGQSSETWTINIDTTPPTYTWLSPLSGSWYKDGDSISIDVDVSDGTGVGINDGENCNVEIDDSTTSFTGTVTYSSATGKCTGTIKLNNPSNLAEGSNSHSITVSVPDKLDNVQTSSGLLISIDNTPPTITYVTLSDYDVQPGTTITVTTDGSDSLSSINTCHAYLDDDTNYGNGYLDDLGELGTDCSGPVTLPSVSNGIYYIVVRPVDNVGLSNTKASSALKIDSTSPSCLIKSIKEVSGTDYSYVSGTTIWYNNVSSGSFMVNVSASDDLAGVSRVVFPATTSSGTTDYSSPYNHTYTWSIGSSYSSTANVTCYDKAENSATTSFTITLDNTPPSDGSITYTDGYYTTKSVSISYSLGSDNVGGVGLNTATGRIERNSAPLSGGVCGSWSGWTTLLYDSDGTHVDETVQDNYCYQYIYRICDEVSNCKNYTSTNIAKVDSVLPTISYIEPPTETNNSIIHEPFIEVKVSTSDAGAGVDKITIYLYRADTKAGPYTLNATKTLYYSGQTSASLLANFTGLGDGFYKFNATVWDQAGNKQSTMTRTVSISLNPTNLTDLSYSCEDDCGWGEAWNFTANITDKDNNQRLNLTLQLFNRSGSGMWENIDSKIVYSNGDSFAETFSLDPAWTNIDSNKTREFRFMATDNWDATFYSDPITVDVKRDDVLLSITKGINEIVNRDDSTDYSNVTLEARLYDVDKDGYVAGENIDFLFLNANGWIKIGSSTTNGNGYAEFIWNPDCTISPLGEHQWSVNHSTSSLYKFTSNSSQVTIREKLHVTILQPTNGEIVHRNKIYQYLRASIADSCGNDLTSSSTIDWSTGAKGPSVEWSVPDQLGNFTITVNGSISDSFYDPGDSSVIVKIFGYSKTTDLQTYALWSHNETSAIKGEPVKINCNVNDEKDSPISSYPVNFSVFNSTGSLISSYVNYTNSSGVATWIWNTSGKSVETYTIKCSIDNIEDPQNQLYYSITSDYNQLQKSFDVKYQDRLLLETDNSWIYRNNTFNPHVATITAKFMKSYEDMQSGYIEFTYKNGTHIASCSADSSGTCSITYDESDSATPEEYLIKVGAAKDLDNFLDKNYTATSNISIEVRGKLSPVTLIKPTSEAKFNKTNYINFSSSVEDENGNVVNANVSYILSGNNKGDFRIVRDVSSEETRWKIFNDLKPDSYSITVNATRPYYTGSSTLGSRSIYIYGFANITNLTLDYPLYKKPTKVSCKVIDRDSSELPISKYNVSFWYEKLGIWTLIGSNLTDTNGTATMWWIPDIVGTTKLKCNISDQLKIFYYANPLASEVINDTVSVGDNESPEIHSFEKIGTTPLEANHQSLTFKANVSDNVEISSVRVEITGVESDIVILNPESIDDRGNGIYSIVYTPKKGGFHYATLYVNDTTNNTNSSESISFNVIGTANESMSITPTSVTTDDNITRDNPYNFTLNIIVNNTGSSDIINNGTMYNVNMSLDLPTGFTTKNITKICESVPVGGTCEWNPEIQVTNIVDLGTNTITINAKWNNPDNSISTDSKSISVDVLEHPEISIEPNPVIGTANHGETIEIPINVSNFGNTILYAIGSSCLTYTYPLNCSYITPSIPYSLNKNDTQSGNIVVKIPKGTDPKQYEWKLRINSTKYVNSYGEYVSCTSQGCYKDITVDVNVNEDKSWSISPNKTNLLVPIEDYRSINITLNNTGNVDRNWTISTSGCGNIIGLVVSHPQSIYVPKISSKIIPITIDATNAENGGNCTIIISFSNSSAEPQANSTVINLTVEDTPPNFNVQILPYDYIDMGKEDVTINATVGDNKLVTYDGINLTKPDGSTIVLVGKKSVSRSSDTMTHVILSSELDQPGEYEVRAYAWDNANPSKYNETIITFHVYPTTSLALKTNYTSTTMLNTVEVNGITAEDSKTVSVNVTINNTKRIGAYNVNLTGINGPLNKKFTLTPSSQYYNKIKIPPVISKVFNITIPAGTPPSGSTEYYVTFGARWENPDGTIDSTSTPFYIKVNPTKILEITSNSSTYTVPHASKKTINITLYSRGNAPIDNIKLSCVPVGLIDYCKNFSVSITPSSTSLGAGEKTIAKMTLNVPFTYPPGDYNIKIVANSSDLNDVVSLPLTIHVPVDTTWNLTPTQYNFTTGSGSYGYFYVNVSSYANVNLSFTTSYTNPNITASETTFTLKKGTLRLLKINYTAPELAENENERNITGNVTVSCTDCGPLQNQIQSSTLNANMRVLPFKLYIENIEPTNDIRAGDEIQAIVNVTFAGQILTDPKLVAFNAYIGDKPCETTSELFNISKWKVRFKAPTLPDGKNYTLRIEAIQLQYNARTPRYFNYIHYKDVTPPNITSVKTSFIEPQKPEEIYVNVTDNVKVDKVWIVIYHNGSVFGSFNLTNLTTNFVNSKWKWKSPALTLPGDYDVVIYANDTTGNIANLSTWFRVNSKVKIEGVVKDVEGKSVPVEMKIYKDEKAGIKSYMVTKIMNHTGSYNVSIPKGKYDITIKALGNEFTFRDVNVESNLTNITRVSDVDLSVVTSQLPLEGGQLLGAIGIEHNISYSSADVILNFSSENLIPGDLGLKNIEVYRCDDWDFDNQTCNGEWTKVENTEVDVANLLIKVPSTKLCAFVIVKPAVAPSTVTVPPQQPTSPGGGSTGISSQLEEALEKLVNQSQLPPISAETDLIEATLHPGESKLFSLYLSNNLNKPVTAHIKILGSIWQFVQLEKDNVTIPGGGSESVQMKVYTLPTTPVGTYTGDIIISTDKYTRTIPITLMVVPPKEALLDLKVNAITKEVPINGSLKYYVTLYNLGTKKRFDVTLIYRIKSATTEEILDYKEETLAIETSLAFVRVYDLSKVKGIVLGKYFIEVIAKYDNKTASAVDIFEIKKPFWTKERIMLLGILAALIISVLVGWKGKQYYDKWKLKKMRYLHPVDMKSLPKGEVWLGKLAEMNVRAEFKMDDLTTHAIVAGATGSGKSVAAMAIAEEVLKQDIPVVVFDPTAQWTGFVRPCRDKKMLSFYKKFGLREEDARPFKGMIYEVTDPNVKIDLRKYMNPGEITVFTLNKLTPEQFDQAVRNIIDSIFKQGWEEASGLKLLVVFDEVHRLLEKFGGKGGYVALEKACREFRKWGIGMVMISQVLADFKNAIKGNVLTEIQMHTKGLEDVDRVEKKFGKTYAERVLRLEVGVGMLQNPKYNKGRPYFINFRPLLHSPHKLPDKQLDLYIKYSKELTKIEEKIEKMKKRGIDTSDIELDLKLAKDKLKIGAFRMAEIYIETLKGRLNEGK